MAIKYSDLNLGQIEALVNKCGGMEGVQRLLSGTAEVVVKSHIIDLNADPFIPDGWKVEEHQKSGNGSGALEWDATKVEFYLDKGQQDGKYIEGNKLRKALDGKPVLNANVLDYLLANPHLIPDDWKKDEKGDTRYIFFWGTIYRYSDGHLCARYLYWDDGRWRWSAGWLDRDWNGRCPAAVRAS
jgi:hypothetical protein